MKRSPALAALLALVAQGCAAPRPAVPERDLAVRAGADEIHCRMGGQGLGICMIGGAAMDLRQWDHEAVALSPVAHVVRCDPRGWGRSSGPSEPFAPHEDLARVLAALTPEGAVLVGSSYGGGIALDCALAHPERVLALVLVAPAIGGYPWPEGFFRRQGRFAQVRQRDGAKAFARALIADPHFVPSATSDPALAARVEELLVANDRVQDQDPLLFRALDPPAFERLAELDLPVLVVTGELDDPDVLAAAEYLARAVPGARRVEIAGAGHLVHMERPEVFEAALEGFLREIGLL